MIKVNEDFSRANYSLYINSWVSLLLPMIHWIAYKINEHRSFKLFGIDVIVWSAFYTEDIFKNGPDYSIHMLVRKKGCWAYRADYKKVILEDKEE